MATDQLVHPANIFASGLSQRLTERHRFLLIVNAGTILRRMGGRSSTNDPLIIIQGRRFQPPTLIGTIIATLQKDWRVVSCAFTQDVETSTVLHLTDFK